MKAISDTMSSRDLLLIEDDDALRRALQLLLTGQGYRVHAFARPDLVRNNPAALSAPDLIVDYSLPGENGIEALQSLRRRGWDGKAVLVSAYMTPELRRTAIDAGFDVALAKPFRDSELLTALKVEGLSS